MDPTFIEAEVTAMDECSIAKTANRSVVGVLNEFSFLATVFRNNMGDSDPLTLVLKLADTPCGPLRGNSPARLLRDMRGGGQ